MKKEVPKEVARVAGAPNPAVTVVLEKAKRWREEMLALRELLLQLGLTEELKWHQACYTHLGQNVLIVGAFKEHFVVTFFKGALIADPKHLLVPPGPNTRGARVLRLLSMSELVRHTPSLRALTKSAMLVAKRGEKVDYSKGRTSLVPEEFALACAKNPQLKSAFALLTPGRQRAYLLYVGGAKQSETRARRIASVTPLILLGKGMNDR